MNLLRLLILYSVMVVAFGCQSRPEIRQIPIYFISLELDYSQDYDGAIDAMERFKYAALLGNAAEMKQAKMAILSVLGACVSRDFSYMNGEFYGKSKQLPLSACSDVTGSSRKVFLEEVVPWVIDSKRYYEDMKKKANEHVNNKY